MITEQSIRERLAQDRAKPSRLATWEEIEYLLNLLNRARGWQEDKPEGDGWVTFGTHANCRNAWMEFSEVIGEDGLPLWERVVVRTHIYGEETL